MRTESARSPGRRHKDCSTTPARRQIAPNPEHRRLHRRFHSNSMPAIYPGPRKPPWRSPPAPTAKPSARVRPRPASGTTARVATESVGLANRLAVALTVAAPPPAPASSAQPPARRGRSRNRADAPEAARSTRRCERRRSLESNSYVSSCLLPAEACAFERARQFLARAEEQHAHAFFFEAQRRGDLAMLEALHVSEPEQELLLRLEPSKKAHGVAFAAGICRRRAAQEIPQPPAPLPLHPPPMINEQRGGNFVEVSLHRRIGGCRVVELRKFGPKKAEKTLLQNIVGQRFIARGAADIASQSGRRLGIENLNRRSVHALGESGRIPRTPIACGRIVSGRCEVQARAQPHRCSLDSLHSAGRKRLAGSCRCAGPLLREMIRRRGRYQ